MQLTVFSFLRNVPRSTAIDGVILATSALPEAPAKTRWHYLLELAIVVACTALLVSIMPAADAINAGWGPKSFMLARMAFLVLLCTWFLRGNGERWADAGLRRPGRWWMVPLLVAGGFLLFIMVSMFMNLLPPATSPRILLGSRFHSFARGLSAILAE
jgi:hypothetical protein